jgi:hypothetical protein
VAEVEVVLGARQANDVLVYNWPTTGLEGSSRSRSTWPLPSPTGEATVGTFVDDAVTRLAPFRDVGDRGKGTTMGVHGRNGAQDNAAGRTLSEADCGLEVAQPGGVLPAEVLYLLSTEVPVGCRLAVNRSA